MKTMGTEVATTDRNAGALATARMQATVDNLYRSIERDRLGYDALPALPSPALRKELASRKQALFATLRPISLAVAEQESARRAIGALLGAYEVNLRVGNLKATAAGYVAHVADQPLFAILAAVEDFKHNRVFDIGKDGERVPFPLDRIPNAFRLLDQVKKCAVEVQGEHHKISRLLAITHTTDEPNISPEEQAIVHARIAELTATMGRTQTATRDFERRKISAEAQEARDRAQRIVEEARRRNTDADRAPQDAQATG